MAEFRFKGKNPKSRKTKEVEKFLKTSDKFVRVKTKTGGTRFIPFKVAKRQIKSGKLKKKDIVA